ncbi:hypothetical protein ACFFWC_06925 [Plantactinospora siamensis]|uniref:Uncharacterized protein n=1 Tax=Plantactinospora siamensis TaxID=555372 RepID=A0ABV6NX35_9ACTN
METEHRAFSFDFDGFMANLAPVLQRSLETGDAGALTRFIEANLDRLRSPYPGIAVPTPWPAMFEDEPAVHDLGDFALTRYYRPNDDLGLGSGWAEVYNVAADEVETDTDELIFGAWFGPEHNRFNPGRIGSFIRLWETVRRQREITAARIRSGAYSDAVVALDRMLSAAGEQKQGLYVTF